MILRWWPSARTSLSLPACSACTNRYSSQYENNHFTEMCSGSEAGLYLRLTDFAYHPTLSWRVIKKKKKPAISRPYL